MKAVAENRSCVAVKILFLLNVAAASALTGQGGHADNP
jgi:hypothetical protein